MNRVGWMAFAFALGLFLAMGLLRYSRGESWRSAFGFPQDLFLQIIGDFGIPVVATVLAMQVINRLAPSRERAWLRRIGWGFFVFLFAWWMALRPALFGWS
ncbi:MAG TPA: hypothetical protein VFQ95_03535 [Rhodanobacteraceae bacterium]|nr:hypothetical protein [Rhodanobacteraceae bacterium]